jgi:hypothetical protein
MHTYFTNYPAPPRLCVLFRLFIYVFSFHPQSDTEISGVGTLLEMGKPRKMTKALG